MSEINIDLEKIKATLTAEVLHKPGVERLDKYPLLAYAPTQHGPGIRTEDKGIAVGDIAVKAAEMPDYEQLAAHFGTTTEHVHQAISYAVAACPVPTPEA